MNNNSMHNALTAAMREAGLEINQLEGGAFEYMDGLYYISFCASFLRFEFYVDEAFNVLGVNTEPVSESLKAEVCAFTKRAA